MLAPPAPRNAECMVCEPSYSKFKTAKFIVSSGSEDMWHHSARFLCATRSCPCSDVRTPRDLLAMLHQTRSGRSLPSRYHLLAFVHTCTPFNSHVPGPMLPSSHSNSSIDDAVFCVLGPSFSSCPVVGWVWRMGTLTEEELVEENSGAQKRCNSCCRVLNEGMLVVDSVVTHSCADTSPKLPTKRIMASRSCSSRSC